MHLPRVTIFRLILAVAVVAIGLATFWRPIGTRAAYHAARERRYLDILEAYRRVEKGPHTTDPIGWAYFPEGVKHFHALADHHNALCDKYERAAWQPWLLLASDPPEPSPLGLFAEEDWAKPEMLFAPSPLDRRFISR